MRGVSSRGRLAVCDLGGRPGRRGLSLSRKGYHPPGRSGSGDPWRDRRVRVSTGGSLTSTSPDCGALTRTVSLCSRGAAVDPSLRSTRRSTGARTTGRPGLAKGDRLALLSPNCWPSPYLPSPHPRGSRRTGADQLQVGRPRRQRSSPPPPQRCPRPCPAYLLAADRRGGAGLRPSSGNGLPRWNRLSGLAPCRRLEDVDDMDHRRWTRTPVRVPSADTNPGRIST